MRYVYRRGDEGTSNGLVHHAQSISYVQLLRIIKIQNTSCNAGLLYVHKLVAESIIVWTLKTVVHRHILCDVSKFMWQLSHMCIIMGCISSSVVYGVSSCVGSSRRLKATSNLNDGHLFCKKMKALLVNFHCLIIG